jgi:molybdopterin molybdotransferase
MSVEERARLPILGVDEALERVLAEARPPSAEAVPLEEAAGRFLAADLRASADMPPFDRTAMDGYALRAADAASVPAELEVIEEIPAGRDPRIPVGPGRASRIMTGAAIPEGADAVVMVERTERLDDGRRVRILEPPRPGQHVRRAGEDVKRGDLLLPAGGFLGAPEVALLAAEGCARVEVAARPSVALLSTGDELVGIGEQPRGSRIRETNSWSLAALLRRMGIEPRRLGIAKDEAAALAERIGEGLRADVFVLTGGVSMGEYDLVGAALKRAGCRALFERVAIQPGRPLLFGVAEGSGAGGGRPARTLVFGLPGNPVSSVVDFLVFARPALRKMLGARRPIDPLPAAELAEPLRHRPGRRAYLPARVEPDADGRLLARPVPSMGSADLVALSRANALVVVPETEGDLAPGARLRVLPLDDAALR